MRCSSKKIHAVIIGAGVLPLIFLTTQVSDAEGGSHNTSQHFAGPGIINHPVDIVPSDSVRIPGDWPVRADGSIHCYTCHQEIPRQNARDPQLRGVDGRWFEKSAFCMSCHTENHQPTASTMHWMGVDKAHIRQNQRSARLVSSRGIDWESKQCLSCHDAITGMDSNSSEAGHGVIGSFSGRKSNHPIGMTYPPRQGKRYQSSYKPAAMLPPEVQLPGGKVSCVSCHNLYSQSPKLLSVTSEGSDLCFSCHEM